MKKLGYLLTGVVLGATLFSGAQAAADGILAQRSSAPFFLNGSPVEVETYLIHGNHFFMLRDIAKLVDFGVTWNPESNTVSIDTMTGYDGEYKVPVTAEDTPQETEPVTLTAYHEQANAAVFDSVYTEEAYDVLRECMVTGEASHSVAMSANTQEAMLRASSAIGEFPSYELRTEQAGIKYFEPNRSSAYATAADICWPFINGLKGKKDEEKAISLACYVCERLDYDANSTTTPNNLFMDNSVKAGNCASFAHGFQFLCNLAEIPCILVHSDIHQWNEVYIGNRWYCVDLTSFEIGYTEDGTATLLHDASELQSAIFQQTEPQLTRFAKELLVPNSTK